MLEDIKFMRKQMKVIMIGSHLRVTGGITRVVKNYIQAGIQKRSILSISLLILAVIIL